MFPGRFQQLQTKFPVEREREREREREGRLGGRGGRNRWLLTCFDKEGMGMYRVISGCFLQRETEFLAAIALEIPVFWDARPRGMVSNSRGNG
jgi:hypothetical protein